MEHFKFSRHYLGILTLPLNFLYGCQYENHSVPNTQHAAEIQSLSPLSPAVLLSNPSRTEQDLRFIESAVTGQDYLEDGFSSLEKWSITLTITDDGRFFKLHFRPEVPSKVNAEWGVFCRKREWKNHR